MPQDDQITAREAAALLGCNVATVNRMARDGRLRLIKKLPWLTGPNIFSRTDVEALAAELAEERSA